MGQLDSATGHLRIGRKPAGCEAWELGQGWKQKEALGVTPVSQWGQARQGGVAALRHHPGGRPKLNDGQRGQLPGLLVKARGLWVQWGSVDPGLAQVIEQFVLRDVPANRKVVRCGPPSDVVLRLSGTALCHSKKGPRPSCGPTKRGFTCCPRCCDLGPGVQVAATISAPSARLASELYLAAQDHAYKGADVIEFLKQLLAEIPASCWYLGRRADPARAVKEYLAQGAARRLQLEQLPGYAPEEPSKGSGVTSGGIEEPGLRRPGAVVPGVLGRGETAVAKPGCAPASGK